VVTKNLLDTCEKKELNQESFRLAHILAA